MLKDARELLEDIVSCGGHMDLRMINRITRTIGKLAEALEEENQDYDDGSKEEEEQGQFRINYKEQTNGGRLYAESVSGRNWCRILHYDKPDGTRIYLHSGVVVDTSGRQVKAG